MKMVRMRRTGWYWFASRIQPV